MLSTLDLVYDRVLSARRVLAAWFFAFNAFAVVTVALPVTFGVSTQQSARAGAVAAAAGFVTLAWRLWRLGRPTAWAGVAAGRLARLPGRRVRAAARAAGAAAPDVDRVRFGPGPAAACRSPARCHVLPAGGAGRLYAVTALRAPLGLRDRVELRWYRDSALAWVSPVHTVSGGRREGFRLWSSFDLAQARGARAVRLDVVTEGGQLVGRAELQRAPLTARRAGVSSSATRPAGRMPMKPARADAACRIRRRTVSPRGTSRGPSASKPHTSCSPAPPILHRA